MTRSVLLALGLSMMGLAQLSCERLEQERKTILASDTPRSDKAIPKDYGNLVSVLQSPTRDSGAILWFQKPDQTIAAVWIDYSTGITKEALLIPRN